MEIFLIGSSTRLLDELNLHAHVLGLQLSEDTPVRVFEVLKAASLGRLRWREDLKLVKITLPSLIYEIRLDLFDAEFRVLKARFFVSEDPPDRLLLLGQFLKPGWVTALEARTRQNAAAFSALRNLQLGG